MELASQGKGLLMLRLALLVHVFLGATFAGSAVVVALSMGWDTLQPVLISALIGWLISVPSSWYVAKRISEL